MAALIWGFVGDFSFLGKKYHRRKFEIIWANDVDKPSCETFRNYFDHDIVNADITEICDDTNLNPFLFNSHSKTNADVVLGGFPCQDFSHAGRRKGINSERGILYRSMVKVVQMTNPLVFVAENVQGLLTIDGGEVIRTIVKDFEELGYHVVYKLLTAADYGVPQTRKRVFIVGSKKSKLPPFKYPEPSNENKWITLREAIGDLETIGEGDMPNHYWSKAKKNKGQGNNILDADKPGPTMRTEHHGNIEFHWNGKRRLSAREAARIQSFPDDFIFYPSTSQAYKQIGNAVPPVLAWHIATSIEGFLDVNLRS